MLLIYNTTVVTIEIKAIAITKRNVHLSELVSLASAFPVSATTSLSTLISI
jgi:hypothetical protein